MTIISGLYTLLAALPLKTLHSKRTYSLQHTYDSTDFFDKFEFLKLPDLNLPSLSNGSVNYVNASVAKDIGLAGISDGRIFLRADLPHNNAENKRDSYLSPRQRRI